MQVLRTATVWLKLPPTPIAHGKVRALTPLAADWFRGVPSPYHPSLPLPSLSLRSPPSLSVRLCLSHRLVVTSHFSPAVAPLLLVLPVSSPC